jgi:PleD family two-component response regulator
MTIPVEASIGLAQRELGESMKELLARPDASMYEQKAVAHRVPAFHIALAR